MTRAVVALLVLAIGGTAHGQTPAPQAQPSQQPSLLEPVKPLTDAYAAGLASCYGWPTAAGVWWCKVDQFIDLWRRKQ